MTPPEDKPDFEKVIDAYLINWDNDNKSRREMAIDLLTQEVENLRLKLKEKEQEIEGQRKTIVHQSGMLTLQDGIVSKLEQSNRALIEALELLAPQLESRGFTGTAKQVYDLIQSEGTTKKE